MLLCKHTVCQACWCCVCISAHTYGHQQIPPCCYKRTGSALQHLFETRDPSFSFGNWENAFRKLCYLYSIAEKANTKVTKRKPSLDSQALHLNCKQHSPVFFLLRSTTDVKWFFPAREPWKSCFLLKGTGYLGGVLLQCKLFILT